jgi:hypothetical protein
MVHVLAVRPNLPLYQSDQVTHRMCTDMMTTMSNLRPYENGSGDDKLGKLQREKSQEHPRDASNSVCWRELGRSTSQFAQHETGDQSSRSLRRASLTLVHALTTYGSPWWLCTFVVLGIRYNKDDQIALAPHLPIMLRFVPVLGCSNFSSIYMPNKSPSLHFIQTSSNTLTPIP